MRYSSLQTEPNQAKTELYEKDWKDRQRNSFAELREHDLSDVVSKTHPTKCASLRRGAREKHDDPWRAESGRRRLKHSILRASGVQEHICGQVENPPQAIPTCDFWWMYFFTSWSCEYPTPDQFLSEAEKSGSAVVNVSSRFSKSFWAVGCFSEVAAVVLNLCFPWTIFLFFFYFRFGPDSVLF